MNRFAGKVVLIVSILSVLALAATASAGDLKPQFKPGLKLVYVQNMDLNMTLSMSISESPMEAHTKRTIEFDREVLKPNGQGQRRLQITIKSVQVEETSPGEKPVSFSSTRKDAPASPEQHLYALLINKPVVVTFDEKNNVVTIDGKDEIVNAAKEQVEAPEQKEAVQVEFDGLFSDANDIGSLVNLRDIDPGKAVSIGDTWEKTWGGEMVDAEKMPVVLTLKSKDGDLTTVTYAAKMDEMKKTLETPGGPDEPPTKVDRLSVQGSVVFDTAKGAVKSSKDEIEIAISAGEGDVPMISMSIKATISLEAK